MTNLNLFNGFEVHPLRYLKQAGHLSLAALPRGTQWKPKETPLVLEEVHLEHAQQPEYTWCWCVYGHCFSGGLWDLAEAPTQEEAEAVVRYLKDKRTVPLFSRRLSPAVFAALFRYESFRVRPFRLRQPSSPIYFRRGMFVRHGTLSEAEPCTPDDANLFAYGLYGVLRAGEMLFGRKAASPHPAGDKGLEEHLQDFAQADEAESAACYVCRNGVLPPIVKWLR